MTKPVFGTVRQLLIHTIYIYEMNLPKGKIEIIRRDESMSRSGSGLKLRIYRNYRARWKRRVWASVRLCWNKREIGGMNCCVCVCEKWLCVIDKILLPSGLESQPMGIIKWRKIKRRWNFSRNVFSDMRNGFKKKCVQNCTYFHFINYINKYIYI